MCKRMSAVDRSESRKVFDCLLGTRYFLLSDSFSPSEFYILGAVLFLSQLWTAALQFLGHTPVGRCQIIADLHSDSSLERRQSRLTTFLQYLRAGRHPCINHAPSSIQDSLIGRQRRRQGRRHWRWIQFRDVTLSTLRGGPPTGCMWLILVLGLRPFYTKGSVQKFSYLYVGYLVTAVPCPYSPRHSNHPPWAWRRKERQSTRALPVPDRYTIGRWNLSRCPFLLVGIDAGTNTNASE
ncbi:hypothetical protein ARMGADRAFT_80272 [Armillaria gallica]|uniref:Uncharacterized protein n=1 Tax=Armillaria gallica TaxID=47427 RepID=A0A2H3CER6_ARMGA|nr:hypothetical protein ARMGADRAFT_80272 [Armillaria gallica]